MDTSNLDTHTYLLMLTASSWLQNKQMELMKHVHTFIFFSKHMLLFRILPHTCYSQMGSWDLQNNNENYYYTCVYDPHKVSQI